VLLDQIRARAISKVVLPLSADCQMFRPWRKRFGLMARLAGEFRSSDIAGAAGRSRKRLQAVLAQVSMRASDFLIAPARIETYQPRREGAS